MDEKDYLMLYFIHKEQSMTKAAELLFTSQPSLSYRLQKIEENLGIKILYRAGRTIEFTPEGEFVASFAQEMITKISTFRDSLNNMSADTSGNLRLGVTDITARYYLPDILKSYTTNHPNVNMHIKTGRSEEILKLLKNKEVHVGIIRGDYNWDGKRHLIGNEKICLVTKQPTQLDELPNIPQIYNSDQQTNFESSGSLAQELSLTKQVHTWWFERFTKPPLYNIQVSGFETCKELVKSGLGYAIIPQLFLKENELLHTEPLTFKNGEVLSRNTWLLYRESSLQLDFLRLFIDEFI